MATSDIKWLPPVVQVCSKAWHEIHITVKACDIEKFKIACLTVGIKPLLLDLQLSGCNQLLDYMTSEKIYGSFNEVQERRNQVVKKLIDQGFQVLRVKIEKEINNITGDWPWTIPSKYYECHIPLIFRKENGEVGHERVLLQEISKKLEIGDITGSRKIKFSSNAFKNNEDFYIIFGTIRDVSFTRFKNTVTVACALIDIEKIERDGEKFENVLVDTNLTHDDPWWNHAHSIDS